MPSLASYLVYASMGFAALASVNAAPAFENKLSLRDIEARCDCKTLPTIVTDLIDNLDACVAPLKFATAANATLANISPIIDQAKTYINDAITETNILAGESASTVLTSAVGVLTVADIAGLLCTLISIVFSACTTVISVVASDNKTAVYGCLSELLTVVADLLQSTLSLVFGLRAMLLPMVFDIMISVLVQLKICSVFSFLGPAFASIHAF